jgi:hypothetical protein
MVVACLAMLIFLWQLLGVLRIFNKAFFVFFTLLRMVLYLSRALTANKS